MSCLTNKFNAQALQALQLLQLYNFTSLTAFTAFTAFAACKLNAHSKLGGANQLLAIHVLLSKHLAFIQNY